MGYINLIVSAVLSGAAAFVAYFAAGGVFNKAGVSAAIAAALAAAVAHLRGAPNITK